MDTNHHVNNAQYIEFARMALTEVAAAEVATDKKTDKSAKSSSKLTPPLPLQQLKRICVQYVHAAVLGDTIVPLVYVEDVAAGVRLVRGVNQCRCCL